MPGLYTEADYENSVIELFRNDWGTITYMAQISKGISIPHYTKMF